MELQDIKYLIDKGELEQALEQLTLIANENTNDFTFCKRYILFIQDNHSYFEFYENIELLQQGIKYCRQIRGNFTGSKQSFFYLQEYLLCIEYIKLRPYDDTYDDDHLEDILTKAIEADPESSENYYARANFYNANDEFELAKEDYQQAVDRAQKFNDLLYLDKANNNEFLEDYEAAATDFKTIIERSGENNMIISICYESLIRIYKTTGNIEEERYYKKMLSNIQK